MGQRFKLFKSGTVPALLLGFLHGQVPDLLQQLRGPARPRRHQAAAEHRLLDRHFELRRRASEVADRDLRLAAEGSPEIADRDLGLREGAHRDLRLRTFHDARSGVEVARHPELTALVLDLPLLGALGLHLGRAVVEGRQRHAGARPHRVQSVGHDALADGAVRVDFAADNLLEAPVLARDIPLRGKGAVLTGVRQISTLTISSRDSQPVVRPPLDLPLVRRRADDLELLTCISRQTFVTSLQDNPYPAGVVRCSSLHSLCRAIELGLVEDHTPDVHAKPGLLLRREGDCRPTSHVPVRSRRLHSVQQPPWRSRLHRSHSRDESAGLCARASRADGGKEVGCGGT
mmetsp:Transcript_28664/g.72650  ORF Transcript_28664/g.72650 Transcript_28664/m.72650 type:complete len:345 (+) Transcript_28664:288-1322(+)